MRVFHPLGDAAEERRRGRIGELIAKALAEDQAEGASPADSKTARGGVWTGVSERGRRREHSGADLLGHEIRTAERLRCASQGDAGLLGNVP